MEGKSTLSDTSPQAMPQGHLNKVLAKCCRVAVFVKALAEF